MRHINRSLGAIALALAVGVAACGSDSSDSAEPEVEGGLATEGSTGTETEGGGEAAGPEGEPNPDATFVYAYPITVSRLDPHRASISQDATTLFPAYDRLVHLSPEGDLIPGLAESWEFSDDLLTLTMELREGVTFHDGTPFDAAGAKANLDRVKSLTGTQAANDISDVSSIEVVDDFTIELTLTEPNVAIIGALADRSGAMVSPTAIADGVNLDAEMVGAGPYRMVSHVNGASTVFERFDDYWDDDNPPQVARLEIRVLSDPQTRLNAIVTGEVDATTVDANQVAEVEANPDLRVQLHTELQYIYIVQNRARAGQDDLRLRQALLHALNRESICEALLFGHCELSDQPFPPGYFANDPDIDQVLYPYDQERARQLLQEAGVDELDLSMVIPAGLPTYLQVSEAIQAQWAEVGVRADLVANEPSQLGELMFVQEQYDAMVAGWGGRADPSMTLQLRGSAEGFSNPGGHTTPEFEELLEETVSIADPGERQEALRAASREMAESVLEMVVLYPRVAYVTQQDVAFEPYVTSKPEFRRVAVHR